jgi:hypothetical protein
MVMSGAARRFARSDPSSARGNRSIEQVAAATEAVFECRVQPRSTIFSGVGVNTSPA